MARAVILPIRKIKDILSQFNQLGSKQTSAITLLTRHTPKIRPPNIRTYTKMQHTDGTYVYLLCVYTHIQQTKAATTRRTIGMPGRKQDKGLLCISVEKASIHDDEVSHEALCTK